MSQKSTYSVTIFLFLLLASLIFGCETSKRAIKKTRAPRFISTVAGTLVIDAGHGGEDSGAVSRRGLKEKDVTLDLARRVKKLVNQFMPNVNVVLTRENDRYVGLEERVRIANNASGDLFLSIHINSNQNSQSAGFEVYSLDVASDRHAERLAARENQSFKEKSKTKFILADLRAHANREKSDDLAKLIASSLEAQVKKIVPKESIRNRGYNQAIFHVLFVNMPAVLAEAFFISNPKEEALLLKPHFREMCARGMVLGINKYLAKHQARISHERAAN